MWILVKVVSFFHRVRRSLYFQEIPVTSPVPGDILMAIMEPFKSPGLIGVPEALHEAF